jgi:osmotically inducible protein OsmC
MTPFERVSYAAKTHTTGGREGGSRTAVGIKLSTPGTSGAGTNQEQLFAAGWSACFLSAIKIVADKMRVTLSAHPAIDAEVDLGAADGVFGLAAQPNLSLPGMDHEVAQALVDQAHAVCPFSRATRGNLNVRVIVVTDAATSQPIHQTEEIHQ